MNKAVVASLLALSAISATGMVTGSGVAFAQSQVNLGSGGGSGDIVMPAEEAKAYNDAVGQTDPKQQAPLLEAYLKAYPQSAVKADVLQRLMIAYSSFDPTSSLSAADRLLQVDPNNLTAFTYEVYFRKSAADAATDPATKQSDLDAASGFAVKGLAATKPKATSDADWASLKAKSTPVFYTTIGAAALNKKDYPAAIAAYKAELGAVPAADTIKPGQVLQDTYFLGSAYYASTPPDLVNCTWYATRAAFYAPAPYNAQLQPLATYCYKKYHGGADGYDAVTAAVQTSINPPASFAIVPAPTPADQAATILASTKDDELASLALSDKEFILQYGKPADAEKVFNSVKGKETEIPDGVVVSATDSVITVSVSDDAVQSKTADFTFNMKTPIKGTLPAVGSKVTLIGTYSSYVQTPVMIVMSDAEIKKPAVKKAAPVHHTTHK